MVTEIKPVNLFITERWAWGDRALTSAGPNIVMTKLAEVVLKAAAPGRTDVGDSIDRGLIALRLLKEAGFELWLADEPSV